MPSAKTVKSAFLRLSAVGGLLLCGAVLCCQTSAAQTWVNLTPMQGEAPAPRTNATAIYDAANHRMIVFGGRGTSGDFNDVWVFDLTTNTWANLTPATGAAPDPRRTPSGVYDPDQQKMIMWSGQGSGFFNDVWGFDLTTATWTAYAPPDPKPNTRYGVASVFDPVAKQLVTFAGFTDAGRFEDTWGFDPATDTWTELTPATGNPGRRCLHSASYDAMNHRMIMYGGQRTGALDDIWALDLNTNTWADLTPAERPAGRYFAAHIYDALNHRALLFGGNRSAGGRTNEVWAFDLNTNTWQALTPEGTPPSERDGATAIYIEAEDRMVVFGGRGSTHSNEVWSLNTLSGSAPTPVEPLELPTPFRLLQNYPNPFQTTTTITFTLPAPAHVTLNVYNLLGQEVTTLLSATLPAKQHTLTWDASELPDGVYVYQLKTQDFVETRRLLLIK